MRSRDALLSGESGGHGHNLQCAPSACEPSDTKSDEYHIALTNHAYDVEQLPTCSTWTEPKLAHLKASRTALSHTRRSASTLTSFLVSQNHAASMDLPMRHRSWTIMRAEHERELCLAWLWVREVL
jgi:hypothetical protein